MHEYHEPEPLGHEQAFRARGDGFRPGLEPMPVFESAESVTLEIEILKETYDEILDTIVANEWEREEGLRTVLLNGLGYLDAKLKLEAVSGAATSPEQAVLSDQMVKDLAAYHSMYSVMKFKAFKLYKVNQVLEFNVSGLRATERMWEGWAERMRGEHIRLQAEVLRLRSLMSEFKIDWDKAQMAETAAVQVKPVDTLSTLPAPGETHEESESPSVEYYVYEKPRLINRVRKWLRLE